MSNSKPNGHAKEAKPLSQSQAAICSRRAKERRKRGAVCIQSTVEPDLIRALIEFGWLLEEQKQDAGAVHDALSALTYQALSAAMRPARSGKAFVPVELVVLQDVACWMKPGTAFTAESAGQALGTAIKCASQMGVSPEVYASTMKQRLGIN